MKKYIPLITIIALLVFAASSFAIRGIPRQSRADRDFKMAERQYKMLIRDHGESPEGWPEENKTKVCKQVNLAITYNNHALIREDHFRQMQIKKQIQTLEGYSSTLGCSSN